MKNVNLFCKLGVEKILEEVKKFSWKKTAIFSSDTINKKIQIQIQKIIRMKPKF